MSLFSFEMLGKFIRKLEMLELPTGIVFLLKDFDDKNCMSMISGLFIVSNSSIMVFLI